MSRLFSLSASAAVAVAVLFAPAARAADEPKDILEKAIKAHGGADFLTKHKATQLKSKGKIDIPGLGETEFTQDSSVMLPDKFKDTLELKVMGKGLVIFTLVNGDKITLEVDGKEMKADDALKAEIKHVAQLSAISRLVPLKDKKFELSLIGEDKVEGKKVVGVRVSAKDHPDVSVYFDKETNLLAKVEFRKKDPASGNEVTEERIITEYAKNKDGVPMAKGILVKKDGKKFLEAEVTEIKLLEKLDDSEFMK